MAVLERAQQELKEAKAENDGIKQTIKELILTSEAATTAAEKSESDLIQLRQDAEKALAEKETELNRVRAEAEAASQKLLEETKKNVEATRMFAELKTQHDELQSKLSALELSNKNEKENLKKKKLIIESIIGLFCYNYAKSGQEIEKSTTGTGRGGFMKSTYGKGLGNLQPFDTREFIKEKRRGLINLTQKVGKGISGIRQNITKRRYPRGGSEI